MDKGMIFLHVHKVNTWPSFHLGVFHCFWKSKCIVQGGFPTKEKSIWSKNRNTIGFSSYFSDFFFKNLNCIGFVTVVCLVQLNFILKRLSLSHSIHMFNLREFSPGCEAMKPISSTYPASLDPSQQSAREMQAESAGHSWRACSEERERAMTQYGLSRASVHAKWDSTSNRASFMQHAPKHKPIA